MKPMMEPMMDGANDMGAEPAPASAAGDLSQGYEVVICVYADGTFGVKGPKPLDDAAEGETFDGIGAALKGVLGVIKDNPAGGGDQANFEAGYSAR